MCAMSVSYPAPIPLRCPHCGHYTTHTMQTDGLYLWAYCGQCFRAHPVVGVELPELVRAVARRNGECPAPADGAEELPSDPKRR